MVVEITLKLPDDLVRDARELGLLETSTIAEILQHELDQRVNALVNKEVHDFRAEKRAESESSDQ